MWDNSIVECLSVKASRSDCIGQDSNSELEQVIYLGFLCVSHGKVNNVAHASEREGMRELKME